MVQLALPHRPAMPCLVTYDADVQLYGAKGDGIADDTAAFQAALAALANGGTLLVRRGFYRITADLVIANPEIAIVGTGMASVLIKGATNINVLRITSAFCRVENLQINGANLAQGSLILIEGADNLVRGCYLHDNGLMGDGPYVNGSHGVALHGSGTGNRNVVSECRIVNMHDIGISQNNARDSRIHDNAISVCGFEGITIDDQSHRSKVHDNEIISACQRGGAAAISLDRVDLCQVDGNTIASTGALGQPGTGIKTNNNLGPSNFNEIVNNIIVDHTVGATAPVAIHLFNGTGGAAGRTNVNGNVIRGYAVSSIVLAAGCNNNKVVGNTLNGVAVSDSGTGNTITAST